MDKSLLIDLDEPRFAESGEILIAGLGTRYTFAANQGIPNQWQRFAPHIGNLANQAGPETYGVCCNADNSGNFEYITGVEVRDFSDLPDDFATVRISPQRYAVFRHPGHVSMLRRTHYTIWNKCCRRRASSSPTGRALSATARISMREPAPARSKSGCRWDGPDVSGDGRDAGGISRFRSSAAK